MPLLRRVALLPLLLLAACGGGRAAAPAAPGPVPAAPAAAVERFLTLAQGQQFGAMGAVFGTAEGPVSGRWPAAEVEQRMYAIASALRSSRHVVRSEQPIPGRLGQAVTVSVDLTQGQRVQRVPFVAVRYGGGWLVEQVDLQRVLGRQQ